MISKKCLTLAAVAVLAAYSAADAQLLYDFEAGIANVSNGAGGGFPNTTVAHSVGLGATEGSTGALQVTKDDGAGFAWVAIINANATAANVTAIQNAYANPSAWQFEFDVTVDPSTMPQWTNFVNGEMVVNSQNGGFDQSGTIWGFGGGDSPPNSAHVTVPLSLVGGDGTIPGGGWLELWFSINGDWGSAPGSAYIDNIRLTPEPASFVLFGLALPAIALVARRRR